jgi:3-hydroxyacyl-[acyl-carrier-protein] dehydratase
MLVNHFYEIIERTDSEVVIRFNVSHPIYAAHFPSGPITPGACLVHIAEELMGKPLCSVSNLKFTKPVLPTDIVTFLFEKKKDNQYNITIYNTDSIYARFIATYMCSDSNLQ